MEKVNTIAEIGINHNGSIEICKKLMFISKAAGFDYVKIQKRNPDVCVPEELKKMVRKTPWGEMSYLDYKYKIEFNEEQIKELFDYANNIDIKLFASVWDIDSANLMSKYTKIAKIGSASITDLNLCKHARNLFDTLIISTGMSTETEIEECIKYCNPDIIMHTNSTYPSNVENLNLRYIEWLKNKYPTKIIGYSGHELGLVPTYAAVALGAKWIERHVTLDRNMWGSDQLSSIMPIGMIKLIEGIKDIEKSIQYIPQERIQFDDENIKKKTLRK